MAQAIEMVYSPCDTVMFVDLKLRSRELKGFSQSMCVKERYSVSKAKI